MKDLSRSDMARVTGAGGVPDPVGDWMEWWRDGQPGVPPPLPGTIWANNSGFGENPDVPVNLSDGISYTEGGWIADNPFTFLGAVFEWLDTNYDNIGWQVDEFVENLIGWDNQAWRPTDGPKSPVPINPGIDP